MVTKREAQQRARYALPKLVKRYGDSPSADSRSVLTQLLFQIVARNWTFSGADRAIKKLQDEFVDWNEVRISSVSEITAVLEAVGAPNPDKKARNIKKILIDIFHEQHAITLDFIAAMPEEKAKEELSKIRGATDAVVQNVLLFGLNLAVVTTYSPVARVCRRMEIVPREAERDEIVAALTEYIPRKDLQTFCRVAIEHGEKTCTFKSPKCPKCIFKGYCRYPDELARKEKERKATKGKKAAQVEDDEEIVAAAPARASTAARKSTARGSSSTKRTPTAKKAAAAGARKSTGSTARSKSASAGTTKSTTASAAKKKTVSRRSPTVRAVKSTGKSSKAAPARGGKSAAKVSGSKSAKRASTAKGKATKTKPKARAR